MSLSTDSAAACVLPCATLRVYQNGTKASIEALVQKLNANKVPQSVGQ